MTTERPSPFLAVAVACLVACAAAGAQFTNSLGQVFVPVRGVSVLFCIWDTRVQDYQAFATQTHRPWPKPDYPQEPTHPAVNVTWDDAQAFCAWLTQRERQNGVLGPSQTYHLPTDAEWSVAAGLTNEPSGLPSEKHRKITGIYPWGRGWPPPKGSGNYADQTLVTKKKDNYSVIDSYDDGYADTSPVGAFAPNRNGLFDMGGNVWQWCDDWYDTTRHGRVIRGGSCVSNPGMLLLSWRNNFSPTHMYPYLGFRCVLAGAR